MNLLYNGLGPYGVLISDKSLLKVHIKTSRATEFNYAKQATSGLLGRYYSLCTLKDNITSFVFHQQNKNYLSC